MQLRDATVAAGFVCHPWIQTNSQKFAAESGICSDEHVLSTYASPDQLDNGIMISKLANGLLERHNIESSPSLVGPNWIIRSNDAVKMQAALGGTILR